MKRQDLIEVRGHARGGQGMVTAFEILAKSFSQLYGYFVQAFPFFGVERTGAPVLGFLRISDETILNRSNIYTPNLIVVFDESLIQQVPVFYGLQEDGMLLLNTEKAPSFYKGKAKNIYTVPATSISLEKGLGTKALPIVNSAMIGAIIKVLDSDLAIAKECIQQNVPSKHLANAEAAEMAYNSLQVFSGPIESQPSSNGASTTSSIPSVPFWDQPSDINKTGDWRIVRPVYETREAPCIANCPAGTDVRLFIKQAANNEFDNAWDTIQTHNPFPSACGRVCPHFCQQNCNRKDYDDYLNIGAIERYIGDQGLTHKPTVAKITHKEKIAVIGSGPAGLTAALRLRQKGYRTVVYEALPWAGGMMRTGIPEFRLPENILDQEIDLIKAQGVEIKLNSKVCVKDIESEYDAVVAAVGSHESVKMELENEEMIIDGISFLRKQKLDNEHSINKGDNVAIIGGGNTAIDVARTVIRLGAKPSIYYRRTRNEMPAIPHEVNEAEAEGVTIEYLTAPLSLEQKGDIIHSMKLITMELGDADESGRKMPIPVKGSERSVPTDKVISAIGQRHDNFVFSGDKLSPVQGKIDHGNDTSVFCSGDMAWGGTVVEAIGSGNRVAEEVDEWLTNQSIPEPKKGNNDIVSYKDLNTNYFVAIPRNHNPQISQDGLEGNFNEAVSGLTTDQVIHESSRCLHCGECYDCGNCLNFCPDAAIYFDENKTLHIDYDFCKGCGICAMECPCSSINLIREEEVAHE